VTRRTGRVSVGLIGTGMISNAYLTNLTRFPDIDVVVLGDINQSRAAAQASAYGIPNSGSTEAVLTHPDVEIVVNLTIPAAHAEVSSAALAAGKHVWVEKPISVRRESARALIDQAAATGLRIGVAPDTVLGPGMQTARRAVARGDIGVPIAAQTTMQYAGPELFHPNPSFLYARGAGPLFDMGPYYLTALVGLLGPLRSVSAVGSRARHTRSVIVGDDAGSQFPVEVPTHIAAIASFEQGAIGQSFFSFDSPISRVGVVEITGTEGTLVVSDPNKFTGDVKIGRVAAGADDESEPDWEVLSVIGADTGRGLGVLDLARAIRTEQPHIASGELGYHVLDGLTAIDEAVHSGGWVPVASSVGDIPLVHEDFDPFEATL
jgi:predicted dehydrogenase